MPKQSKAKIKPVLPSLNRIAETPVFRVKHANPIKIASMQKQIKQLKKEVVDLEKLVKWQDSLLTKIAKIANTI